MEQMKPKILFKFRPVSTAEQLARLIDSINNNKIFFPDYKKLNDPLESAIYMVEAGGYAGCSITRNADDEDTVISNLKREYRILSLTDSCFSPSMWAYYANEHNGICIGYWNQGIFATAKQLTYLPKPMPAKSTNEYGIVDFKKIGREIKTSFFYKHSDWEHENEWRIVKKQKKNEKEDSKPKASYLRYDQSDLACIIFGENMSEDVKKCIIASINNIPALFKTNIGYRTFGINLLPNDYKIQMNGSNPPFIRNIDDLITSLKRKRYYKKK